MGMCIERTHEQTRCDIERRGRELGNTFMGLNGINGETSSGRDAAIKHRFIYRGACSKMLLALGRQQAKAVPRLN